MQLILLSVLRRNSVLVLLVEIGGIAFDKMLINFDCLASISICDSHLHHPFFLLIELNIPIPLGQIVLPFMRRGLWLSLQHLPHLVVLLDGVVSASEEMVE